MTYSKETAPTKQNIKQLDLAAYLQRLEIVAQPVDFTFLKKIHKAHLIHIPFENLDIHYGHKISLDVDALFQKIINEQRGGICYELNILIYHLLLQLGYDCFLASAQVYKKDQWSPDFDHVIVMVRFGEEHWLVDVGFGNHIIEPKKLVRSSPQLDYTRYYKFDHDEMGRWVLKYSKDNAQYVPIYRFDVSPKAMIEFIPRCDYHQESLNSYYKNTKIITKLFRTGRITLTDKKLTTELLGKRDELPILNEDAFFSKLEYYFGVDSHKLVLQRFQ